MPTLEWIGKDKVVNHHLDVPYRVLNHQYTYGTEGQTDVEVPDGNKIIRGDNLEALKALLPQYEGKIKCIYIDPPYNTGNEGWVYNDNVNDPKIKKWLGDVVGKEGEDLCRHDKWLCMMYPRLKLLQRLLADDGAIFISIDDNEQANLKLICDEIFGASNFITSCIWQGSKKGDSKFISISHEYIMVYVADKANLIQNKVFWRRKKEGLDEIFEHYEQLRIKHHLDHEKIQADMKKWYKSLPKESPAKTQKHYSYSDDRGLYFADNFAGPNDGRDNRPRYDIIHPVTGLPCKKPATGWRWDEEHTNQALTEIPPRIHFGATHETIPCRKSYLKDVDKEPFSSVFYRDGRGASGIVDQILGKKKFEFPKDFDIIQQLFGICTEKDSIILDSFAGSGTTAHAVLNMNKADGGNRKFILIEMMDYAETITAERVRRVIGGYGEGKNAVEGTGGDFGFYDLGVPLLLDNQYLNEEAPLNKIRSYVYFMETKCSMEGDSVAEPYRLGEHQGAAYYFYYQRDSVTTLDHEFLQSIQTKAQEYIIYADKNALSQEEMTQYHIVFKKIPRDIARL